MTVLSTRFNYDGAIYGTAYSSLGLALHPAGDNEVNSVISLGVSLFEYRLSIRIIVGTLSSDNLWSS